MSSCSAIWENGLYHRIYGEEIKLIVIVDWHQLTLVIAAGHASENKNPLC
jgi:hypothetical protein